MKSITRVAVLPAAMAVAPTIPDKGLAEAMSHFGFPKAVTDFVAAFCPLHTLFSASDRTRAFSWPQFWFSLAAVAGVSWTWLLLVAWRLRYTWRDRPRTAPNWNRFGLGERWRERSRAARVALRRRLLEINPFFWLAGRQRVSAPVFMLLTLVLACITVTVTAPVFEKLIGGGMVNPIFGQLLGWFWTGLALHALVLYYGAHIASQRLAEDKQTGALELVLSTPVSQPVISRGLWLAYGRRMLFPGLAAVLVRPEGKAMHREHHRWNSQRVDREMGINVYGHYGQPLGVFPTSGGDEDEYEGQGIIAALAHHIDGGRVKVFCVNSINNESWYNKQAPPAHRTYLQAMYDSYVAFEVAPFVHDHCRTPGIGITTSGSSFGAYHAVNTLLKHPDLFGRCLALSGVYDLRRFMNGHYDDNFYFNNPVDYMANLSDLRYLQNLRQCDIRLVTGTGPYEDSGPSYRLADIIRSRGIPCHVDDWGPEGGRRLALLEAPDGRVRGADVLGLQPAPPRPWGVGRRLSPLGTREPLIYRARGIPPGARDPPRPAG